jgi:tRNA (uracil-5-)-methyltransferase TRM9
MSHAIMSESDSMGAAYEQRHVHEVYESIAAHFSQTRYKPWPIVAEFLDQQPAGSLGLDVGSGNGTLHLSLSLSLFSSFCSEA